MSDFEYDFSAGIKQYKAIIDGGEADWIVMATGRRSVNSLHGAVAARGVSVETIGDATAPRSAYEAVYEGHRQARKL